MVMARTAGWMLGAATVLSLHRWAESSLAQEQKHQVTGVSAVTAPCWKSEEYVISKDCYNCNQFESTLNQCSVTGFVEQVSCATSKKAEYKSCRSALMEKRYFWEFVGIMLAGSVLLSLVVVSRQRTLDRRALEKVRKQIESI
ncbi:protein JTB isoform X2 [Pseudophryne corroboree]|uniref:protein JTB isoform X2 n=1 Tax=Pseudophryne corroboree TaxID=495146 RepID=UPI0030812AB2